MKLESASWWGSKISAATGDGSFVPHQFWRDISGSRRRRNRGDENLDRLQIDPTNRAALQLQQRVLNQHGPPLQ
jgi:hypothetical protein